LIKRVIQMEGVSEPLKYPSRGKARAKRIVVVI
jgi:hypothetical protein